MAVTIDEGHMLHAMEEIQKAAVRILGRTEENDLVISYLAKIEQLTVRPEATREWEAILQGRH